MPELPELEVVKEVLQRRVVGKRIEAVRFVGGGAGIVIRDLTHEGFDRVVSGSSIESVARRGKYLVLGLTVKDGGPFYLAINPKLTGRLHLAQPGEKHMARTHVVFVLADGQELRYVDQRTMGQLYLARSLEQVPEYAELGPEPFDLSAEEFRERLKPFRGEIKGILVRGRFVAGIGNAYADEILWAARIHPYRKRTTLSAEELQRLYDAMQSTLRAATDKVRAEMREAIHLKPRDFMAVHMKGGQPCPRCGATISLVGANQRMTNFCRQCQPGGLIKGL